jgi:hypothetical protein
MSSLHPSRVHEMSSSIVHDSMDDPKDTCRKRPSRWCRSCLIALAVVVAVVAVLFGVLYAHYRWEYPYGVSHCCDRNLFHQLTDYAAEHGGVFPSGEETPEASLSLLYPKYAGAKQLRGKTVPLEIVEEILQSGRHLGPETCGWHYVEGLTVKDDHRIAIFWDKIGLGHSGYRLPEGGHYVMFLSGFSEYIPESDWPAFLEEQETLLQQRILAKKPLP